ncbi:MAG: S-layer homology domain-containing protein [Clostridiales bacterium]|nr:S-layer homology domain-containing protein [Clostridiales bacterium]MDY4171557.1 S-layer homology domain-containing protein [Evtepia sp.]
MRKRILAGVLSLVMILALLPVSALAAEGEPAPGKVTLQNLPEKKIDIAKDNTGRGTSFTYKIAIDLNPYYETYIKPLLQDNGKFQYDKNARKFTITFPSNIFDSLLKIDDWNAVGGPPGTSCVELLSKDGNGVVLKGKAGASSSYFSEFYLKDFVSITVPVTLPAESYQAAAEKGEVNLQGYAIINTDLNGVSSAQVPPAQVPITHSLVVEDSSNLAHSLSVAGANGAASPTFEDISWNLNGGEYTVSGEAKDYEGLKVSGDTTIKLDNATIKHTSNEEKRYAPAISIEAGSDAKLILSGTNTIEGGPGCAGIYVAPGATLTISGDGTLNVTGGASTKYSNTEITENSGKDIFVAGGAGIGGNGYAYWEPGNGTAQHVKWPSFGTVKIAGGTVNATGGTWTYDDRDGGYNVSAGAGIGAGGTSSQHSLDAVPEGTVEISGGSVTATGGDSESPSLTGGGAGIGAGGATGGHFSPYNNRVQVTISGGTVTATGKADGAGIGGGANMDGGDISITGGKVNATGGYEIEDGVQYGAYGGAGIGGGDNGGVTSISITGGTVTAKAIGAAAGIGSGNDGFVGYINHKTNKTIPGSISIGRTADVTAYGGSHVSGTKFGGAGIGAGQSYYYDNGCGAITISGNAKVKAYAGPTAQAIGVGANYEANAGKDVNSLTIADTVTLWAQNQDKALPALLNETVRGKSTLTYNSTDKYLVSNTADENKAVGYFQLPNGEATEFDYTLENGKLTIGGVEITAAAPVDHVGNWATLYGKPQYTVTYYVDGEATKTEVVQGGEEAPEPPPAPSKSGYVFVGWSTDAGKTDLYNFDKPVTGDLSLYARFVKVEVKIEIEVKIDVDIIGTDRPVVSIGDDQKDDLAENVNLETDVQSDTNVIEIDAIVKKAEDKAEIDKITEHLTKNQYNCGDNRIDYDVIVQKIIRPTPGTPEQLHTLAKPIQITFAIPDKWQSGGTVYMFRAHVENGTTTVEKLVDLDNSTQTFTIESDKFSTYTMIYVPSPGGGTTYYTLHYESNGGTQYKDERHRRNTVVNLDKVPVREGYQFTGWYGDKDLTEQVTSVKMTGDKTVYAGWHKSTVPDMLNGEDHFAYVIGYGDGTVHPGADISRAEVATIFFRLLKPEIRDGNLTDASPFADVSQGMWCNKAIATMAKLGIVKGRTAETFAPSAPITRAEFAAICARFDTGMTQGSSNFTDLAGHWAKEEIERAVSLGWIMGYADGTFRPDNPITRAEAMTMINRVLCRIPEDGDDLLPGMKTWPDNQSGDWYYLAVQEATNSHEFQHKGEIHEHWTKLTADPDWTRYQD